MCTIVMYVLRVYKRIYKRASGWNALHQIVRLAVDDKGRIGCLVKHVAATVVLWFLINSATILVASSNLSPPKLFIS